MTTIRPDKGQRIWSHFPPRSGVATGEIREDESIGAQEHLILWDGDTEPTWADWRHVHDEPVRTVNGTRWCPTCRKRRDLVDQSDESEYTGGAYETHFTAYVLDCGHTVNFDRAITRTAP